MRTTKDPAVRREDILNAAADLFAREGYQNTTVESIVQKAGIAKGSFYNYFNSKEGVSEAIIERMANNIVIGAKKLLTSQTRTPKQRLMDFIDYSLQMGVEQSSDANPLVASENNPSIKTMYMRASDDGGLLLIPIVADTLKDGNRIGEMQALDEYFTAVAIVGMLQRVYSAYFDMKHNDTEKLKKCIMGFMGRLLYTNFSE